ncbi:hypothetical protein A0257_20695 [Hymenobacter psoromatis]|nr:hypothetical protein A0257_20695 [Hymenobacter psoromatis]
MPSTASIFICLPAFRAVTIGLGLFHLVAALAFARPGAVVDFGWPDRFDFGPSFLLTMLTLCGGAWAFRGRAGTRAPQRAGWRGAAYGVQMNSCGVLPRRV